MASAGKSRASSERRPSCWAPERGERRAIVDSTKRCSAMQIGSRLIRSRRGCAASRERKRIGAQKLIDFFPLPPRPSERRASWRRNRQRMRSRAAMSSETARPVCLHLGQQMNTTTPASRAAIFALDFIVNTGLASIVSLGRVSERADSDRMRPRCKRRQIARRRRLATNNELPAGASSSFEARRAEARRGEPAGSSRAPPS